MHRGSWALGLLTLVGCGPSADAPLDETFTDILQSTLDGDESIPGIVLTVRFEDLTYEGAVGETAFEGGRALRTDDLFRIASVTKTFTSASLFTLAEEGLVDLDSPIAGLLTADSVGLLSAGGYDPSRITLRQLLEHTAGIYDYTEAGSFYATIEADPRHRWTRREQLQLAMDEGHRLNAPGQAYHYGDTHYILAGEILEQLTGLPLAEALRQRLDYAAHGLGETYLESLEPPPSDAEEDRLTHPYIGDEDTRGWDPSWDLYGGGGLVSTTGDLVRFMDTLFIPAAGIFQSDATLAAFVTMPDEGLGELSGIDGGPGINRFYYEDLECFVGLGYFTTWLVRCPAIDLTFAYTESQSDPRRADRVAVDVIGAVY